MKTYPSLPLGAINEYDYDMLLTAIVQNSELDFDTPVLMVSDSQQNKHRTGHMLFKGVLVAEGAALLAGFELLFRRIFYYVCPATVILFAPCLIVSVIAVLLSEKYITNRKNCCGQIIVLDSKDFMHVLRTTLNKDGNNIEVDCCESFPLRSVSKVTAIGRRLHIETEAKTICLSVDDLKETADYLNRRLNSLEF